MARHPEAETDCALCGSDPGVEPAEDLVHLVVARRPGAALAEALRARRDGEDDRSKERAMLEFIDGHETRKRPYIDLDATAEHMSHCLRVPGRSRRSDRKVRPRVTGARHGADRPGGRLARRRVTLGAGSSLDAGSEDGILDPLGHPHSPQRRRRAISASVASSTKPGYCSQTLQ